jgi:hypothetical protein
MAHLSPLNYLDWWFAVFSILASPMSVLTVGGQIVNFQTAKTAGLLTRGQQAG